MYLRIFFIVYLTIGYAVAFADSRAANREKVIICGVCQNASYAVENTIRNVEELGSHFRNYAVIFYENNSRDKTSAQYSGWARKNPKVLFLSEVLKEKKQPLSRTERIARARNIVLTAADHPKYADYKYLIMVDLDFVTPWPIEEILNTLEVPSEWDCVAANGTFSNGLYYDRYAFRDQHHPFGPENLGDQFWDELPGSLFTLSGEEWIPVHSAFGGLAIYKTNSLLKFRYSGIVTKDLKTYCKQVLLSLPATNQQLKSYLSTLGLDANTPNADIPVLFQKNTFGEHPANYEKVTCCEHVPLHASMSVHGHGKIFINPKMIMKYH